MNGGGATAAATMKGVTIMTKAEAIARLAELEAKRAEIESIEQYYTMCDAYDDYSKGAAIVGSYWAEIHTLKEIIDPPQYKPYHSPKPKGGRYEFEYWVADNMTRQTYTETFVYELGTGRQAIEAMPQVKRWLERGDEVNIYEIK